MMVKRSATHEPSTCHQQSHNTSSICIRSATSRSAAGTTAVLEAKHARTRIRSDTSLAMTDEWASTTTSWIEAWVTHVQKTFSTYSTLRLGEDEHAVAFVAETLRFTGRARGTCQPKTRFSASQHACDSASAGRIKARTSRLRCRVARKSSN